MIIDLPKEFTRTDANGIKYVYIEDGILKLRFNIEFKRIMRELIYSQKGHKCYYCGKKMDRNQMTVDHIIPQDVGGPTITNNLALACHKCNGEKSNMNAMQYKQYLGKKTSAERIEYSQRIQLENEKLKTKKNFPFLNDWVIEMPINKIRGYQRKGRCNFYQSNQNYNKKKKTKYAKIEEFYRKYDRLHKAIVVDRNNRLLGGYTSLMFAKNNHLKTVPVIKLENVEIFY